MGACGVPPSGFPPGAVVRGSGGCLSNSKPPCRSGGGAKYLSGPEGGKRRLKMGFSGSRFISPACPASAPPPTHTTRYWARVPLCSSTAVCPARYNTCTPLKAHPGLAHVHHRSGLRKRLSQVVRPVDLHRHLLPEPLVATTSHWLCQPLVASPRGSSSFRIATSARIEYVARPGSRSPKMGTRLPTYCPATPRSKGSPDHENLPSCAVAHSDLLHPFAHSRRRSQSGRTTWLTTWPAPGPSPARSWAATRIMMSRPSGC